MVVLGSKRKQHGCECTRHGCSTVASACGRMLKLLFVASLAGIINPDMQV